MMINVQCRLMFSIRNLLRLIYVIVNINFSFSIYNLKLYNMDDNIFRTANYKFKININQTYLTNRVEVKFNAIPINIIQKFIIYIN